MMAEKVSMTGTPAITMGTARAVIDEKRAAPSRLTVPSIMPMSRLPESPMKMEAGLKL